jgi:hypothetical protein
MALPKRELYRQVKGPEITRADRCSLVSDADSKKLYVEREIAHLEASDGGTVDYQTVTMDIADYLTQGGLRQGFSRDPDVERRILGEHSPAVTGVPNLASWKLFTLLQPTSFGGSSPRPSSFHRPADQRTPRRRDL